MYAALWRVLPGPVWLRILMVLVLVTGVLAALAFWVFPWVLPLVSVQDSTVQE